MRYYWQEKWAVLVSSFIVLVAIIAGGIFLYNYWQNEKQAENQPVPAAEVPVVTPPATVTPVLPEEDIPISDQEEPTQVQLPAAEEFAMPKKPIQTPVAGPEVPEPPIGKAVSS